VCLPFYLKNLTLVTCLFGGLFGYLIRNVSFYFTNKSLNFYFFSFFNSSIWFIPLISTINLIFYPLILGFNSLKFFDQGWSEYLGGQKIYTSIKQLAIYNQLVQNNNLKVYFLIFIFWVVLLILLIFL
jgi:NADH-ubiquinone oxidoreductase chain 5